MSAGIVPAPAPWREPEDCDRGAGNRLPGRVKHGTRYRHLGLWLGLVGGWGHPVFAGMLHLLLIGGLGRQVFTLHV